MQCKVKRRKYYWIIFMFFFFNFHKLLLSTDEVPYLQNQPLVGILKKLNTSIKS